MATFVRRRLDAIARLRDGIRPTVAALPSAFGVLTWLEQRRPLRRTVTPKALHVARNLLFAVLSAAVVQLAERPLVRRTARAVERDRLGLLPALRLPRLLEDVFAVVLMDYTLYVWHVLTHRVPALWRFHAVHHVDRDLDASTALRFHAGELLLSVPWRVAQVRLIGVSSTALATWQTLLLLSIMFHHSNVRLPVALERVLARVVVTPRLHGIHHSVRRDETDSNWSSGLTLWDWLHGTLCTDVPQDAIEIGAPGYAASDDDSLPRLLALPFQTRDP